MQNRWKNQEENARSHPRLACLLGKARGGPEEGAACSAEAAALRVSAARRTLSSHVVPLGAEELGEMPKSHRFGTRKGH